MCSFKLCPPIKVFLTPMHSYYAVQFRETIHVLETNKTTNNRQLVFW